MKQIKIAIIFTIWILFMLFVEHKTEQSSYQDKVLSTIKDDFKKFESLPSRLKKDETFLKKALKANGMILKYFDKKYKANKEYLLLAVKENGMALQYANNMLKSDEEVVLEAVREDGSAFKFAHQYLRKSRNYVWRLLKAKILFVIDEIDSTLQQDRELIEMALLYDESAFKYVDKELREDREYILKFLKSNGWLLGYLDKKFRKDKELVTIAVMNDTYALKFADKRLRRDKKFLLSLIEKKREVLENIDEEVWKEDSEFLSKILKERGFGLKYATKEQKNDRELVLNAIEHDGFELEYASEELKKDKELVIKALDDYSDPLSFADSSLQNDRAFIIKAIEMNAFSITSIDNTLSRDRELIDKAVIQNVRIMRYLPKLQKDKEFIIEMIRRDINMLPYINESLKEDRDILEEIERLPSKDKNIEEILSWLAVILLSLFIYFVFVKKRKYFLLLVGAILLLIVVEILKIYFVHGVFRTPYVMVDESHKFGLKRTRCWAGEEENLSRLECYDMYVPEIYGDPKSRVISFPVRVFRSDEIFSTKPPVIHLGAGGPGADMGLDSSYVLQSHLEEHDAFSINQGRDFFVIDPRGAGLSKPLLACDSFVDNFLENMKKDLTMEKSYKVFEGEYAKCVKKFKREKVNFNGYNSVAVADDIQMLSKSVGIDKWVLFGVSYSTTYAMFVAKKYPKIVEQMILDSACFPDLKLDYNYLMQTMDSYNALYNYKDKIKNFKLVDNINAKDRIWSLHKKLNKNPIHIDYLDLKVDGNYFVESLLWGVYDTKIFKDLPKIVSEMDKNNTKSFLPYFEEYIDYLMDGTYGDVSAMAHYCYEDKPFINFSKIEKEQSKLPKGFIQKSSILSLKSNDFCREMNISSNDKTLAEPIKTDIPTLFIHGEFDPVTPLRDVITEMKNFKNSEILTYKTSHSVLGTEKRVEEDVAQFLIKF